MFILTYTRTYTAYSYFIGRKKMWQKDIEKNIQNINIH